MKRTSTAVYAAILSLCATVSQADIVTVTFSGTVVDTAGLAGISIGDSASGTWTYENSALSFPLGVGELFDTNGTLNFEINGIAGASSDLDVRLVDVASGPRDELNWTTFWWEGAEPVVSGDILSLGTFNSLRVSLVDNLGLSIQNGELPAMIEMADWDVGSPGSGILINYQAPACCTFVRVSFTSLDSHTGSGDSDGDSIDDSVDNCIDDANPGQQDTNGDGYGNACDPDLNNDGIVNAIDLGLFRAVFFTPDPDGDFNSDGIVNALDLGVLKLFFFMPPGPSALVP